jgi:MoxR-like ATPase
MASNLASVVVTSQETVRLALVGLFSEGHILLEDLPGVGKTLLAKTLARSIDGDFKRVQFTPDLLPSDITGTTVFEMHTGKFQFVAGPVFCNVLLADEINRTGPRTQAALLEAMAESQVTVDGQLRQLPRPFFVIATQNFSESHGTFPLPDSQKDRFLISMGIGLPTPEQESEILLRAQQGVPEAQPVLSTERVIEMQDLVRRVEVSTPVREYIVHVLRSTRQHEAVSYGASPRGGAALQRAAQCCALLNARHFVAPEDVSEMARSVLPHRLILKPGVAMSEPEVVEDVLGRVPVPA